MAFLLIITDSVLKRLHFPEAHWKIKLHKDHNSGVIGDLKKPPYTDNLPLDFKHSGVYVTHLAISGLSFTDNISHILNQLEKTLKQTFGAYASFTHVALHCGINSFISSYKPGLCQSLDSRKQRENNYFQQFKRMIIQLSWALPQAKLLYMGSSSLKVKNSETLTPEEANTWRNEVSGFYSQARLASNEPNFIQNVKFLHHFLFQKFHDTFVADPHGHVKHEILIKYMPRLSFILNFFLFTPFTNGAVADKNH